MSESEPASGQREDPRLKPWRMGVYATGDLTVNVVLSALSMVYTTYFLIEVAGLRPEIAGAVQLFGRSIDAITDPLMGRVSDRYRSRLGRRRPFLLMGCIPFGLCFALLWASPASDSQWALFAYYSAVYIGASLAMTMVSVPYLALQPELASGYDARTSLNTWRSVGSLMGVIGAVSFRPIANALGGGPEGFALAGALFGVGITLPWFAVVAVTWERPDFQERPTQLSLWRSVAIASRQPTFRRLVGIYLTGRIAIDLASATLILYFTHVLGRIDDFEPVMLLLLVSVMLSLPLWLHFSQRTEKSRLVIIGAAWWALCSVILLFAQPEWPRVLLFVFPVVTGIGYAAVDLMPWSMVGEVVDEDELATGERQEGIYYGVFTFLRKLTGSLAVGLALALLGYLGLEKGQPANDAVVFAIRLLAGLGPIVALLASIQFARQYPLTRARHREILEALDARNGTGSL